MIALYMVRTKGNNNNGSQPVIERQPYRRDTGVRLRCSGYFELPKRVMLPASNFEILQL